MFSWLVKNVLLTQQMFSDWSTMCYLHNRCSLIGQQCVTYTPSISCNHFCWWTTCCHCSGNIIFVVYGMWCIRITTKLQRRKIKVSWSFLASYFSHYSVVRYDDCGLYTTVGQYWYGLLYIYYWNLQFLNNVIITKNLHYALSCISNLSKFLLSRLSPFDFHALKVIWLSNLLTLNVYLMKSTFLLSVVLFI